MNYLTTMYFVLTCVAGLAQYGALLLNVDIKSKVWKRGIWIGMIGSAYSAGAFALPRLELFPCMSFIASVTVMLCCVVASYYTSPVPESYTASQREARDELRHSFVRQIGIGLGCTIILATVVAFTQGQTADNRVQVGFAGVVYRLSDEVKALHVAVSDLSADVRQLKKQASERQHADSIARKQVLKNQEMMLRKVTKAQAK